MVCYGTGMIRLYKTKEVAEILGLNSTNVEHYLRSGIVVPERRASGRGSSHKFSVSNIIDVAVTKFLADQGISLDTVNTVLLYLRHRELIRQTTGGVTMAQIKPYDTSDGMIHTLVIFHRDDGEPDVFFQKQEPGQRTIALPDEIDSCRIITIVNLGLIIVEVERKVHAFG